MSRLMALVLFLVLACGVFAAVRMHKHRLTANDIEVARDRNGDYKVRYYNSKKSTHARKPKPERPVTPEPVDKGKL